MSDFNTFFVYLLQTYVQDLLKKNGREVYDLLVTRAGHFYICGDVEMAQDVEKVIIDIIRLYGNMDKDDADDYISEMKVWCYYIDA